MGGDSGGVTGEGRWRWKAPDIEGRTGRSRAAWALWARPRTWLSSTVPASVRAGVALDSPRLKDPMEAAEAGARMAAAARTAAVEGGEVGAPGVAEANRGLEDWW